MNANNEHTTPETQFEIPLGITRGLSSRLYHADRSAISSTKLKAALLSGQHFLAGYEETDSSSESLLFGQVLHKRLLEPDTFFEEFWPMPAVNRATTAGRLAAADADAARGERIGFPAEWLADIDAMVTNVMRHATAAAIVRSAEREVAFSWIDPDTGVKLKIKTDLWHHASHVVADVKSSRSVLRTEFARQAASYGYHLSAAMYCEGLRAVTGDAHRWYFLAIEKTYPFSVAVYEPSDSFLRRGRSDFRKALQRVAQWRRDGVFPPVQPDGQPETIDLPAWF